MVRTPSTPGRHGNPGTVLTSIAPWNPGPVPLPSILGPSAKESTRFGPFAARVYLRDVRRPWRRSWVSRKRRLRRDRDEGRVGWEEGGNRREVARRVVQEGGRASGSFGNFPDKRSSGPERRRGAEGVRDGGVRCPLPFLTLSLGVRAEARTRNPSLGEGGVIGPWRFAVGLPPYAQPTPLVDPVPVTKVSPSPRAGGLVGGEGFQREGPGASHALLPRPPPSPTPPPRVSASAWGLLPRRPPSLPPRPSSQTRPSALRERLRHDGALGMGGVG